MKLLIRFFLSLPLAWSLVALPAFAQSRFDGVVPLQELVREGIITQEQAEAIRDAKVGIEPRVDLKSKKETERLAISGYGQFEYVYIAPHDDALPNPAATNTLAIQNLIVGLEASIGEGFRGVVNMNFANGFAARNYLDGAWIQKKVDNWGTASIGYKKAHFGLEQYTSSRVIPAVQRSIMTNYFTGGYSRIGAGTVATSPSGLGTTRLGLGARRLGLFWQGDIPDSGLSYFAEVTQTYQDFTPPAATGSRNVPGFSGGVEYDIHTDLRSNPDNSFDLSVGFNATYQPDGNSLATGAAVAPFGVPLNASNSITGINPWVQIEFADFHLIGEYVGAWVENGRASGTSGPVSVTGFNTATAFPYGFNAFASYLFDGTIEPVFRFSYIDSDRAGINPSVVSNGPAFGNPFPGTGGNGFFNTADSYYFGFNWYILGNAAKLSAGYERVNFHDRYNGTGFSGADTAEDVVRVRMQLVF